ncbi:MAG: SCO family protein [Bacteroidetes bacterium]|nr:SCO family protein [Bacteroidota bacterium]
MNKKWFYAIFAVVLLGGFYLGLFWGNDLWKKKLPVLNDVKPFAFVSQSGDTITNRDVEGKVQVVEYFFTTCKGICPKMNNNMKVIAARYADESNFVILSHTVDPDTDSVARLKTYADSLGAKSSQWIFLTGTKEKLYASARESYLLDDQNNNKGKIEEQFIHTQLFALVDKNGRVRGVYDGLQKEELARLNDHIDLLLKESYSGPRFVNGIFQNNPQ